MPGKKYLIHDLFFINGLHDYIGTFSLEAFFQIVQFECKLSTLLRIQCQLAGGRRKEGNILFNDALNTFYL